MKKQISKIFFTNTKKSMIIYSFREYHILLISFDISYLRSSIDIIGHHNSIMNEIFQSQGFESHRKIIDDNLRSIKVYYIIFSYFSF